MGEIADQLEKYHEGYAAVNHPIRRQPNDSRARTPSTPPSQIRQQFLREGRLDQALESLRQELRTDFDNPHLKKEFDLLRRTISLQKELIGEKDAERWNSIAQQLCRFYRQHRVCEEYVNLSFQIYQRSPSDRHAAVVIDAYVLAGQYEEAVYFVDTLNRPEEIARLEKASIYLAAEEIEKARHLTRAVSAKLFCTSEDLLRLARLQAATRLHATAVKTLIRCFEATPSRQLERIKREALDSPEFEPIRDAPEFIQAMKTSSRFVSGTSDMPCSKKWIGVKIDETPAYLKNFTTKEIKFEDWRVHP